MNTQCQGFFGKLFGHSFVQRCETEKAGTPISKETLEVLMDNCPYTEYISDLIDSFGNANDSTKCKYIYDICQRCGTVVKNDLK